MKQFVHHYKNSNSFKKWIFDHSLINSSKLMFEINYSIKNDNILTLILNNLNHNFPDATVIGISSCKNILQKNNNIIFENGIIISVILFEKTSISSFILNLDIEENKNRSIEKIDLSQIKNLVEPNTKSIKILSNSKELKTSLLIDKIGETFKNLKVFGAGASGDNNNQYTLLFHKNIIYKNAIILVFMSGNNLSVNLLKKFNWKPIGKRKVITKSIDNKILTIDDYPALDIYKLYFPNIEYNKSSFFQIPLFTRTYNCSLSSRIIETDNDMQTITSSRILKEGSSIQLSIGDYNDMMDNVKDIYNFVKNKSAEAVWISASISYEYGFRIPLSYYLKSIKDDDNFFVYLSSEEYYNNHGFTDTYYDHTFIIALMSESNNESIGIIKPFNRNFSPLEISNQNLYSIVHKTSEEFYNLIDNLENIVIQRTEELKTLNNNLEIKIENAVAKEKNQSAMLHQQSKLASMGELLEDIAHQWRQPLASISLQIANIQIKIKLGQKNELNFEEIAEKLNKSISFLSDTIETFRNFLNSSDKDKSLFNIKATINNTISIIREILISSDIKIEVQSDENIIYNGFKNDLEHIIMNLINNARDAFVLNKIENCSIKIKVYHQHSNLIIAVTDNAGGIDRKIIKKIFEPYFTTKHKSKGTGLGLYLIKQLLKKVDGDIEIISSLNEKTTFIIKLPLSK